MKELLRISTLVIETGSILASGACLFASFVLGIELVLYSILFALFALYLKD